MLVSLYHRLFHLRDQIAAVQKSSFPGCRLIGSSPKQYRSSEPCCAQRVYSERFLYRPRQNPTIVHPHHLRTFSSSAVSQNVMSNIPDPQTFVYSTVGNLEVKLDLYVPPNATGTLPAIVCFHGGGLTVGDRYPGPMTATWLLGSFDRHTCLEPQLIGTFQRWPQLMG